jgi:hypothetical protein
MITRVLATPTPCFFERLDLGTGRRDLAQQVKRTARKPWRVEIASDLL